MKHKGYHGKVSVDVDNGILHGTVLGIQDVVTFEGTTVPELVKAFEESVDEYLAFCAEVGHTPEKPPSGRLLVRMKPTLHGRLSAIANAKGVSVNRLVVGCLEREAVQESDLVG
ncbi:MAG: type II toxin-antitoxin system HicB family antitoxin [Planctomycetaceae bacterium]|nr:type II toxin-antitoxin system HicB family antitoxin [Planctomycetaceae bacterium]